MIRFRNLSFGFRIAVMTYDYRDMCKGRIELTGVNALGIRLLKAQGYKVIEVPYTEFKATDKLTLRVKYLDKKLKEIVCS